MKKSEIFKHIWRVTYAHTIAYAVAGIVMMYFMNYEELWAMEVLSFYKPIDDPIHHFAIALQVPRGILIALFILPLYKAFFEEKYGLWKLGLIVFGFSLISTIGAPWASYESYIYARFPLSLQIKGYPEAILYIGLFIGILYLAKRFAGKKAMDITAAILMTLVCLITIAGYLS